MKNENSATKLCKHCKTEIPKGAKICPNCKKKQGGNLKWIILIIISLVIIVSAFGGSDSEDKPDSKPSENVNTSDTKGETAKEDDNVPSEYKSALNKAKSYSDMMHMSKAGIYDQLTSEYGEQFTEEAAQYAMDSLSADWNANALAKAEEYSSSMHMSKAGIYDQLTSENGEQFTAEEAQYAIDNIKADWNANALAKAKDYQEMDISPAAIHDQLTSEYGEKFTQEEADYAIANLDK